MSFVSFTQRFPQRHVYRVMSTMWQGIPSTEINRISAGLEMTRIVGKVESARHHNGMGSLNQLLEALGTFQATITRTFFDAEACE